MARAQRVSKEDLRNLFTSEMTLHEISEALGYTYTYLARVRETMGLGPGKPVATFDHDEAKRLWRGGMSESKLALHFNVSRPCINSFLTAKGLRGSGRYPISEARPPSLAMLRLAEFDPVVARAVRSRLGLAEPDEELVNIPITHGGRQFKEP